MWRSIILYFTCITYCKPVVWSGIEEFRLSAGFYCLLERVAQLTSHIPRHAMDDGRGKVTPKFRARGGRDA
jgi:hypothetical protein